MIYFLLMAGIYLGSLNVCMGGVRELNLYGKKLGDVYLKLGRSTVLRFPERPMKVVIGNKNFFNIEFVENDLTIQPLAAVETNLFVYGESKTYGMQIKATDKVVGQHDDLVVIRSYPPKVERAEKIVQVGQKAKNNRTGEKFIKEVIFKDQIYFVIKKVFPWGSEGQKIIEGELKNLGKDPLKTKEITLTFESESKEPSQLSYFGAFEKDEILTQESTRMRIIFLQKGKEKLRLKIKTNFGEKIVPIL